MTSTDLAVQERGVLSLSDENQKAQILQALGLDLRQPLTQALVLVAQRYDLDPLLKQVQIIKGNVYITHAGLLHIAHSSGKLDGIVVEEESLDSTHFRAKVSVYRKDMNHPFTYSGEFAKAKVRSEGASGREMALKNAERSALRRAFDITAPTMDDSGQDYDDVPPGSDIDLPAAKPSLPGADANALPVPESSPPNGSAMPAPAPVAVDKPADPKPAPKMPEGTLKVPIPETGEVVLLSPNGHIVNEKTGGEVLAATEEQQALQARARQIVAEAQKRVDEKEAKPAPAKRVAKAVKKAAPAKAPAEKTYTEEEIKRGQSIHMKAKELGIEETLMRDVVFAITDKRTKSTREVSHDEADTVKAIMTAIAGDLIDLTYDPEGVLVFDMMDNPLPPDDAEEDIPEAEVVNEPRDWKEEANSRGISDGTFLRTARRLAEEMGLAMPGSYKDITDPGLAQAMSEWLEEAGS